MDCHDEGLVAPESQNNTPASQDVNVPIATSIVYCARGELCAVTKKPVNHWHQEMRSDRR